MPGRNLAKRFAIGGFILGEIYMLLTVLGPYSQVVQPLPLPMIDTVQMEPGTPPPTSAKVSRALISALFFGPFGAIVGTGVGLLASGLRGDFRRKDGPVA
jgi:hypothetical protein